MIQQFDEQFIHRFLKPLIMEIMLDMREGKKHLYLRKLLLGTDKAYFTPEEKTDFIQTYFLFDKTKPASSLSPEDRKFQEQFLEKLLTAFQVRNKLSGVDGTIRAFFPGADKKFSEETNRNLYDMSYKMLLGMEQDRISALIEAKKLNGEISSEKALRDQGLLAEGKLKLIITSGREQYVSNEEIAKFGANPAFAGLQVMPLIAPGTGSGPNLLFEAGKPYVETAPLSMNIGSLGDDFSKRQAKSLEMLLEKKGLELISPIGIDANGIAHGKVKAPTGQILDIDINTKTDSFDPGKFKFTFHGGSGSATSNSTGGGTAAAAGVAAIPGAAENHDGESFFVSQELPELNLKISRTTMEVRPSDVLHDLAQRRAVPVDTTTPDINMSEMTKPLAMPRQQTEPGEQTTESVMTIRGKKAMVAARRGITQGSAARVPGQAYASSAGYASAAPERYTEEEDVSTGKPKRDWKKMAVPVLAGVATGGGIAAVVGGAAAVPFMTEPVKKALTFVFMHCLG